MFLRGKKQPLVMTNKVQMPHRLISQVSRLVFILTEMESTTQNRFKLGAKLSIFAGGDNQSAKRVFIWRSNFAKLTMQGLTH